MPEQEKGRNSFKARLKNTYRLVILNDETFEELSSYRLTMMNFYIFISSVVLLMGILILSIIIFTPIKQFIPGYGDANKHPVLIQMNQKIASLESQLEAQEIYISSFRKMLTGDVETRNDTTSGDYNMPDSLINVDRIKEDELLRKAHEDDESLQPLAKKTNFPEEKNLDQLYLIAPVKGQISAGYMPEKRHFGVDVLAPSNTPIKTVLDGVVITSDWTLETGNTLCIQHENDLLTCYKHNSSLLKKTGDVVRVGEAVAIIGNTGTLSTGPHLHFELWHRGKPLNPTDYLNFN